MTTFGQGQLSRSFTIRYLLVDADTSYFPLIGRKTLNELGAIVSTPHLKMKFPTLTEETVTVKANQKQARQCYAESLDIYQASLDNEFDIDPRDNTSNKGPKPIKELVKLQLGPKPKQCIQLSRDLTSHEHRCIVDVLYRNTDLFAWQPSDITRIHPSIICRHKLAICPQAKPVS